MKILFCLAFLAGLTACASPEGQDVSTSFKAQQPLEGTLTYEW